MIYLDFRHDKPLQVPKQIISLQLLPIKSVYIHHERILCTSLVEFLSTSCHAIPNPSWSSLANKLLKNLVRFSRLSPALTHPPRKTYHKHIHRSNIANAVVLWPWYAVDEFLHLPVPMLELSASALALFPATLTSSTDK